MKESDLEYQLIKDKLEQLKKEGKKVPSLKMLKTKEQIEGIRLAGVLNTQVLDEVEKKIHAGMSTEDINTIVHNFTTSHGGICAPLNYEGFPKSVCVSVNDAVCHGIPSKKEILKDGDIVNVDVTTILNGYYADASRMFIIGNAKPNALKLVKTTKECLELCIKELKPWTSYLGDIGEICFTHAKKNGFSVVKEIGGHGVGLQMHEDPYVSHIGKRRTGMVLVPGMVFTIEPMVNEGSRYVYQDATNGWTIYTYDGKLSAQVEHTFLITEDGIEIITK